MPECIPISALQHWLYCPRQCALIHLEQAWAENRFTAEGRVMHENAHHGPDESRAHVRITRGMAVASERLALTGQCDIVEFHGFESQISDSKSKVVPVEYKRGKPKAHRADEVQLCAQAICLEEMLGIGIPVGHLYYGQNRRRTEVIFDEDLRSLTTATAAAVHALFESGITPTADYDPKRCDACSLIDHCQPKAMRFKKGVATWFASALKSEISNLKSLAESCSRQLRAWADSLQNSDIKGQRHLNDQSRDQWDKKKSREAGAQRLTEIERGIVSKLPPDHPARREWERRNGPLCGLVISNLRFQRCHSPCLKDFVQWISEI